MPYTVLDPSVATEISLPALNPAAPLTNEGLTLAQARNELRAALVGRTDVEAARIDFWLNRAYIDVATSANMDELKASLSFNTVADQPLYLIPTITVTTMTAARKDETLSVGAVPLKKIDLQAYRMRHEKSDEPTEFFRSNRLLVLWPTPDNAHEIILDYRFEPLPLVNDTDSPVLRPEWHEAWLVLARKKLLSAVSEWEAAIATGNELSSHIRTRKDHEAGEDEDRVISSSVPRTRKQLLRRNQPPSTFIP